MNTKVITENHTIEKVESSVCINTSFHDFVIRASKSEILEILGIKPEFYRSGETHYDWSLLVDGKYPCTIYDRDKSCKFLKKAEVTDFHIGWEGYYMNEVDENLPESENGKAIIEALREAGLRVIRF